MTDGRFDHCWIDLKLAVSIGFICMPYWRLSAWVIRHWLHDIWLDAGSLIGGSFDLPCLYLFRRRSASSMGGYLGVDVAMELRDVLSDCLVVETITPVVAVTLGLRHSLL